MKTLSYINGTEQEIEVGAELYFGQIWDGDELFESGSVSPDGETIIVRFDVLERNENDVLESTVRVTGIDIL